MEFAAISPTVADGRVIARYADITMDEFVALVDTDGRCVEIHRAGAATQRLGSEDFMEGGDALPGFQVAVRDLIPD